MYSCHVLIFFKYIIERKQRRGPAGDLSARVASGKNAPECGG